MAKGTLTYAQAETLVDMYTGGYSDCINHGLGFHPNQVFPERNNDHNGKRRCLTAMQRKGFFSFRSYTCDYVITPLGKRVWEAWRESHEADIERMMETLRSY